MAIFTDLPDEVLFETTVHLHAIEREGVANFSLVSHGVRSSCLRTLFETIHLYPDVLIPQAVGPPPILDISQGDADHLRRYIKTLVVAGSTAHEVKDQTIAILAAVLPRLTGLSTFRSLDSIAGIWQELYALIATIPHLSAIEFISSSWTEDTRTAQILLPSIKRLTYGHVRAQPPEYQDDILGETRQLNTFLLMHGKQLTTLEIPCELGMFSILSKNLWPSLRHLSLHGYPFIGAVSNSDIARFLDVTPALETFHIEISRTQTTPSFTILDPTDKTLLLASDFLPSLHTFSSSIPEPNDGIFRHMPPNLRVVELTSYPRSRRFVPTEDLPTLPITSAVMATILSHSPKPKLKILRVTIGPFERTFIDAIVRLFPLLEILELQVLRPEDVVLDARENATILAEGLSPLNHLHELRLQELVYDKLPGDLPAPSFESVPGEDEIWASPFYNVALTIGSSVFSIRKVVFVGGYECPEICRVEMRRGEVITFWQATCSSIEPLHTRSTPPNSSSAVAHSSGQ